MRSARFVATLGFVLALGLAGVTAGCGGDSQQPAAPKVNAEGKTVKEQVKQERLELQAGRKGAGAGNPKKGKN